MSSHKLDIFEDTIKETKKHLKEYLEEEGVLNSNNRYLCINPLHEDHNPSATIFVDDNDGQHLKCWSCLPYHEKVITNKGYIPIGEIKVGDYVYDKNGEFNKVKNVIITNNKEGYFYNIKTYSSNIPITLTEDHKVFVLNYEIIDNTKDFQNINSELYLGDNFYANNFSIKEKRADELDPHDFLLYPVKQFDNSNYQIDFIKNTFPELKNIDFNSSISEIEFSRSMFFFIFGYCLVNSVYIKDNYIEILDKDKCLFDISKMRDNLVLYFKASNFIFKESKYSKSNVFCFNSSVLTDMIRYYHRSDNLMTLNLLPLNFLQSFIEGIRYPFLSVNLGSFDLAKFYYDSCLRLGYYPTFKVKNTFDYIVSIKNTYKKQKDLLKYSYIYIGKTQYYITRVKNIERYKKDKKEPVYDIEVENSNSFCTTFFTVHNCNHTSDIYLASHILEKMPVSGTGFFNETIPYLANRYKIKLPEYQFSEEERNEILISRIYNDAYKYITSYEEKDIPEDVYSELSKRKWLDFNKNKEYGIGLINSFDSFRSYLKECGHSITLIEESGLSDSFIFNKHRLIYCFKDEHGRIVGFIARNLKYDGKKDNETGLYINGPKYLFNKNPSNGVKLLKKESRLYLLDKAKRTSNNVVYIVEGQPDALSFHYNGYDNFVSLSGVSLTLDHFNLLRRLGIHDVVICFDGDKVGRSTAEALIDTILKHINDIRVRFIFLPANEDEKVDPDLMARNNKFDEFFELPKISPYDYILNKTLNETDSFDPDFVCNKIIPIIITDPSPVRRESMINNLSLATNISTKAIKEEVSRILENKDKKLSSLKKSLLEKMISRIEKLDYVSQASSILDETLESLRQIDKESASEVLDPKSQLGNLLEIKRYEESDSLSNNIKVDPNLEVLMKSFDGDLTQKIILIPSPPNVGGCYSFI